MKSLVLLAFALTATYAQAERLTPQQASKQIAQAVEGIAYLAESGVEEYKTTPADNVKQFLKNLALDEDIVDDEQDFDGRWQGFSSDAWEVDSTNWGEVTMKGAYSYIFDPTDANLTKGKEAFKLFLNTGVQFGVAPLGAVQCGIRFAGLAILDPHTGKVYIFAKEGSGC